MDYAIIEKLVQKYGGELDGAINWTWAHFPDDIKGKECFAALLKLYPAMDHRGYYDAIPGCSNPNLRRGGFRFR